MIEQYSGVILMGNTIRLKNTITDIDGNPYTPDTLEIKIYDGKGVLVNTIENSNIQSEGTGTGIYYVDYIVVADNNNPGKWRAVWTVSKDTKPNVDYIEFEVIKVLGV